MHGSYTQNLRKKKNLQKKQFFPKCCYGEDKYTFDKFAKKLSQFFFAVSTRKLNTWPFSRLFDEKTDHLDTKNKLLNTSLSFICHKAQKLFFKIPQRKKIFRKKVFLKMLLWTIQIHFRRVCQKILSETPF